MNIQKVDNQSFGMAVKYRPSYSAVKHHIFEKLDTKANNKIANIEILQEKNPVDVFVSLYKNKKGENKIMAEVGANTYKENFFRKGADVIAAAARYADKLQREQNEMNELLYGCKGAGLY